MVLLSKLMWFGHTKCEKSTLVTVESNVILVWYTASTLFYLFGTVPSPIPYLHIFLFLFQYFLQRILFSLAHNPFTYNAFKFSEILNFDLPDVGMSANFDKAASAHSEMVHRHLHVSVGTLI